MDLEEIKSYDDSFWLNILKQRTVFDTDNIKAQKEWLIEQAEKAEQMEEIILRIKKTYEDGDDNELDEMLYILFSNEPETDDSY